MSSPFDYVSNGIWPNQGQCQQQSQHQQRQNVFYPNGGPTSTQSQMSGYMYPGSTFNMPVNDPVTVPIPPPSMQWNASTMMPNMSRNMMMASYMMSPTSRLGTNAFYNVGQNEFQWGYGQQYPPSQWMPYSPSANPDPNKNFALEPGVQYVFVNGKPVPVEKKEVHEKKHEKSVAQSVDLK